MALTGKHRWAVIVSAKMDYTSVTLHERQGEPMNHWQPHSDTNRDRWVKRDEGYCYLRRPEGRATSEDISMVDERFGFTREQDARDWFEFFTQGPRKADA